MKPSPKAVTFISTDQHHGARNAISPQTKPANRSVVGHEWPAALLLPHQLRAGAASAVAAWLRNPSKKWAQFQSSKLAEGILNISTSGSCSDFAVDVRGLFCWYLKYLKCQQWICHIYWALLPLTLQLQGYPGFISRCSFALLQRFLGRARETFFRSSEHLLPLSCKNLSTSLTRGMEISLEAVACTCVL